MQILSGRLAAYNGSKIPNTPSVRNYASEVGKKLLRLQIRVLGVTIEAPTTHSAKNAKKGREIGTHFPTFVLGAMYLVHKTTTECSSYSHSPVIPNVASPHGWEYRCVVHRPVNGVLMRHFQSGSHFR